MNNSNIVPIPTYVVNLKRRTDRRQSVEKQFDGRTEFDLHFVEAEEDADGAAGIWRSLVKVIGQAEETGYDRIVFCEDDHVFTEHYSSEFLLHNIAEAERKGAELVAGGVCGYGTAVPVGANLYWTDWYWGNQFLVIGRSLYRRILDFEFGKGNTADGVLSYLAYGKMVIYPFVSVQREFGYSDITPTNGNRGFMSGIFGDTAMRLDRVHRVSREFNYGCGA